MWTDGDGSLLDAALMALAFFAFLAIATGLIKFVNWIADELEPIDRATRYDETIHDHDRD